MDSSSKMLCVDASLVSRIIGASANRGISNTVAFWESQRVRFVAPDLLGYEISNGLHRDSLYPNDMNFFQRCYEILDSMEIELVRYPAVHTEAIQLARRFGHAASYDAHYLAVAARYGVDLYTCDRKLAKSVEAEFDWVHYLDPSPD